MRRYIPRFTVRRLLIFVLCVAAYLACWEATRQAARSYDQADIRTHHMSYTAPCPFWIVAESFDPSANAFAPRAAPDPFAPPDPMAPPTLHRHHYFWLFGFAVRLEPRAKLPEWRDEHPGNVDMFVSQSFEDEQYGPKVSLRLNGAVELIEAVDTLNLLANTDVIVDRKVGDDGLPGSYGPFVSGTYVDQHVGAIVLQFAEQCNLVVKTVDEALIITLPD